MAFTRPRLTIPYFGFKSAAVAFATIDANVTSAFSTAWPGVDENALVFAICPTLDAGIILENPCRCVADGVVLRAANVTIGQIAQGTETVFFVRL